MQVGDYLGRLGEPGFFYPFWIWDLGLDCPSYPVTPSAVSHL